MASAKCVVVGDSAVGKLCLLVSYTKDVFSAYARPSFSDTVVQVTVDEKTVSLHLWDTAPQEEYNSLRVLCYHNASIGVICFSIASPPSFENVRHKWYPEVRHHDSNIPVLLVGTKKDLRHNPEVNEELQEKSQAPITPAQGVSLAKEIRAVRYMECSAFDQEGVREVFLEAAKAVLNPSPRKQPCCLL
ncbi:rho-related GTP-binding protein RhoG-like [Lissotriton helveticus]